MTIPKAGAIRDELEKLVLADLHGPAGGSDEELDEASVSERYLVGMLAPKRNPAITDLFDELAVGGKGTDEEGKVDIAPPQAESLIPSSFGLTFAVSAEAKALKITARWGHYLRTDSETLTNEKGNPKKVWKRTLRQGVSDPVPLVPGPMKNWVVIDDQPEVIVRGLIRKNAGDWIVTLFLVNGQKEQERLNDEQWLFQPELLVESADGSAAFVKRAHFHDPQRADPVSMNEERMMAMAYRHQSEFAVGHNVAVHVEPSPDDPARALRVSTWSVPVYDVPMQTPPTKQEVPALADLVLDMKALAESKPGDLLAKLKALPEAYAAWIEARNIDPDPTLAEFANEKAVDELCSWVVDGKRVRPKVIASTATIRRAASQVQQLFLRRVDVFPPQGTDVRDNFFSVQRPPSEQFPGRRYFGICAPGKRIKTGIIRVYVAHLAAAQKLYEKYGKHADPWMTMVGYFNSLRELGGARRLVDDSVRSLLRETVRRGLANRKRPLVKELTSRMGATDIPDILDLLEVGFDPDDDKARKEMQKSGKQSDKSFPIDVLLATNMVSVGVDVKRLGLMVVAGQPKTTAEYIQATSRVGRSRPGLVCTLYNWARPRDLSHYERFEHYHATFYQHVEGLSVTPFAARALDRGLSALLVALVRLAREKFNPNAAAAILDRSHAYVKRAIEQICKRAVQVDDAAPLAWLVVNRNKHNL